MEVRLVFSPPYGSREGTQVKRLSSMCLYLQSHLTSPVLRLCLMVSSESYVVLGLPVRSVISFKLTFVTELRLALTSFLCI